MRETEVAMPFKILKGEPLLVDRFIMSGRRPSDDRSHWIMDVMKVRSKALDHKFSCMIRNEDIGLQMQKCLTTFTAPSKFQTSCCFFAKNYMFVHNNRDSLIQYYIPRDKLELLHNFPTARFFSN